MRENPTFPTGKRPLRLICNNATFNSIIVGSCFVFHILNIPFSRSSILLERSHDNARKKSICLPTDTFRYFICTFIWRNDSNFQLFKTTTIDKCIPSLSSVVTNVRMVNSNYFHRSIRAYFVCVYKYKTNKKYSIYIFVSLLFTDISKLFISFIIFYHFLSFL